MASDSDSVTSQSLSVHGDSIPDTDIVHTWIDGVPLLSPTSAQYRDFPSFLDTAEALDINRTGVIKVNRPANWYEPVHNPLPPFLSNKCYQYQVQRPENGVFEVATTFCQAFVLPTLSSSVDDVSAPDLITRMEKLWETYKTLNRCRYLPNIDIQTPVQRAEAGLPPTCMVWPNHGD